MLPWYYVFKVTKTAVILIQNDRTDFWEASSTLSTHTWARTIHHFLLYYRLIPSVSYVSLFYYFTYLYAHGIPLSLKHHPHCHFAQNCTQIYQLIFLEYNRCASRFVVQWIDHTLARWSINHRHFFSSQKKKISLWERRNIGWFPRKNNTSKCGFLSTRNSIGRGGLQEYKSCGASFKAHWRRTYDPTTYYVTNISLHLYITSIDLHVLQFIFSRRFPPPPPPDWAGTWYLLRLLLKYRRA